MAINNFEKSKDNMRNSFYAKWQPMIDLMSRARSVEFKIRVVSEYLTHSAFHRGRSFDEFMKVPRKQNRKKVDRHIKDIFGKEQNKIVSIRQVADALAHADYLTARKRIKNFKNQYGLNTQLSTKKAGILFVENVVHDDGVARDIGYILDTSEENLILEEFEVFEKQGYIKAAEEILIIAENKLHDLAPNIDVAYTAMIAQRALKYGERKISSKN